MESWTDLVYASIYLSAHPDFTQSLLNYIHIICTGHKPFSWHDWRMYDEQFCYQMSADHGHTWDTIDDELWLLYMQMPERNVHSQQNAMKLSGHCYDFNFKGMCYTFVRNAQDTLVSIHSFPVQQPQISSANNSTEMKPSASKGYHRAVNSNFCPRSSVNRFMDPNPFPNKYREVTILPSTLHR